MPPHSYSPDNWNRYQHLDVRPANAALGAEVRCGDLRQLSDAVFAEIRQAWLDHLVLVFHGQTLTGDELLAVGARFGTLDDTTRPQPKDQPNGQLKTNQALSIISNVKENGEAIGALGHGDLVWHTDMSYIQTPPDASLLYALEVPSEGGQTGFSNMYLAFDTLPADLKALAASIKIKHDATHNSGGSLRNGFDYPSDVSVSSGVPHSAVRTHPETGCSALYLGRRPFSHIAGMSVAASEVLLDRLWAHASTPNLNWYQTWSPGDIVIWDNRCAMHRRNAFPNTERRVMHRTQIKGTLPFVDAAYATAQRHCRAGIAPSA